MLSTNKSNGGFANLSFNRSQVDLGTETTDPVETPERETPTIEPAKPNEKPTLVPSTDPTPCPLPDTEGDPDYEVC